MPAVRSPFINRDRSGRPPPFEARPRLVVQAPPPGDRARSRADWSAAARVYTAAHRHGGALDADAGDALAASWIDQVVEPDAREVWSSLSWSAPPPAGVENGPSAPAVFIHIPTTPAWVSAHLTLLWNPHVIPMFHRRCRALARNVAVGNTRLSAPARLAVLEESWAAWMDETHRAAQEPLGLLRDWRRPTWQRVLSDASRHAALQQRGASRCLGDAWAAPDDFTIVSTVRWSLQRSLARSDVVPSVSATADHWAARWHRWIGHATARVVASGVSGTLY